MTLDLHVYTSWLLKSFSHNLLSKFTKFSKLIFIDNIYIHIICGVKLLEQEKIKEIVLKIDKFKNYYYKLIII